MPYLLFILYLFLSLLVGKQVISRWGLAELPLFSRALLGYLLLEGLSFSVFVLLNSLGLTPDFGHTFWTLGLIFIPTLFPFSFLKIGNWLKQKKHSRTTNQLAFSLAISEVKNLTPFVSNANLATRTATTNSSCRSETTPNLNQKKTLFHQRFIPASILFTFLLLAYFTEANSQIFAVLTGEGVIYQDIAYHAGLTNAIMEWGFPVVDYQYAGRYIGYHFFTHFICAKWVYLLGISAEVVYVSLFTIFSLLAYSLLITEVSQRILPKRQLSKWKQIGIGILAFYAHLILGGYFANATFSFYFSYSFQFQILLLLIILNILSIKVKNPLPYFSLLLFTFAISIITKGSSLPLLLAGFGWLSLTLWMKERKFPLAWMSFTAIATVVGAAIYAFFFTNADNPDFLSFFGYNDDLIVLFTSYHILDKVIPNLAAWSPYLFLPLLLISVVGFRWLAWKEWQDPRVAFSAGMLIAGVIFCLFFTNNPAYFLLPTVFISGALAIIYFIKKKNALPQWQVYLVTALLILSTYPISSKGFSISKGLKKYAQTHYAMTETRYELYQFINQNTEPTDIIFTPTLSTSAAGTAHNYFPAAFAKRSFLLGGYLFGGLIYAEDFANRVALVDSFSLQNVAAYSQLRKYNCHYILIEKVAATPRLLQELDASSTSKQQQYEVLLENEAGMILKLNSIIQD
ncbi:MAG: hypothetical protein AB8G22_27895 [Saprospiraceae bacterium]